jgi:4-hydroxy-tetrahydrodipicolinate synthase
MTKTLQGSLVALATPFKNGALDEDTYRAFIRWQLQNGTSGLVPVGTTGEAVTMNGQERFRAVQLAVEEAKGKVPVVGGAGSNSTQDTIESMARVREAGADAALIVTPYYNKPTQAGLAEHYRALANAHPGFPIVAYNVPGRTGVDLLPETVLRLCDIPEIVALKEATASMVRTVDLVELCGDRLTLLSGDDFTVVPFVACGGKGVITVSGNIAPRMMAELVQLARDGAAGQALALQVKMNALHRLLFVEPNPIPVKRALTLMGKFGPELRLPLLPMTEGNSQRLEAELKKLGLL